MNGMNKMNVVNGMNGVNGMSGMMNGHSDYVICQARLDDTRLRKSNLISYSPRSPRYRCSPFAGSPNGFSQFHSGSYYAHDMNPGFGPVGTRMLDIDRYGGFVDYQRLPPTCCPTRSDPRLEFNPSFHPHGALVPRSPAVRNQTLLQNTRQIKGELYPKIKFVLFERTLKIAEENRMRPEAAVLKY